MSHAFLRAGHWRGDGPTPGLMRTTASPFRYGESNVRSTQGRMTGLGTLPVLTNDWKRGV